MTEHISELHIFLVEPSKTQAHIISNHLKQLGITRITVCRSGDDVFENLASEHPNLIISAMYLPDMTGNELIHKLRDYDEEYEMAFMLISSETNIESLDPIRQAGAIAILPKPFSKEELIKALSSTKHFVFPEIAQLEHLDIEDISVLLVDDSAFSLKYISRTLSNIGIENISLANNGQEAIDILESSSFDIILTDYNMPVIDGVHLATYIRQQEAHKNTPIIMLTSEQDPDTLDKINKSDISCLLGKPFDPASLRESITRLLS